MAWYYYQHADGGFSNAADYPKKPTWEPEAGGNWVNGEPDGLEPHKSITLADALMTKYAALPDEVRGAFSHIMGGVKASLEMPEPDTKAAYWAIKLAPVPKELEAVKQQLVDLLEG